MPASSKRPIADDNSLGSSSKITWLGLFIPRGGEEMKLVEIELKWFQFRERLIHWRNQQTQDQLDAVERSEERSVSILQKRYGYTRLQAISELHKHYSKTRLE